MQNLTNPFELVALKGHGEGFGRGGFSFSLGFVGHKFNFCFEGPLSYHIQPGAQGLRLHGWYAVRAWVRGQPGATLLCNIHANNRSVPLTYPCGCAIKCGCNSVAASRPPLVCNSYSFAYHSLLLCTCESLSSGLRWGVWAHPHWGSGYRGVPRLRGKNKRGNREFGKLGNLESQEFFPIDL